VGKTALGSRAARRDLACIFAALSEFAAKRVGHRVDKGAQQICANAATSAAFAQHA
jgi:hypothetical protein